MLYGKSINVIRRLLPTNWNLAMAQAAATPKSVLSGTTISATISAWARSPLPNHSAMSGASARIGTAWAATR